MCRVTAQLTLCACACVCVVVTQGDIQQLLIVDDPRAAETYCRDFIPDCDAPLPYDKILAEPEEVSPLHTANHGSPSDHMGRAQVFHDAHAAGGCCKSGKEPLHVSFEGQLLHVLMDSLEMLSDKKKSGLIILQSNILDKKYSW